MKLNLKSDIIFKIFFGKKGNEEFLIDFLNALLKIEIKTIKIEQKVDLGKLSKEEKIGRLDLQATLNNGIIVDVEMQVKEEHVSDTVWVLENKVDFFTVRLSKFMVKSTYLF